VEQYTDTAQLLKGGEIRRKVQNIIKLFFKYPTYITTTQSAWKVIARNVAKKSV